MNNAQTETAELAPKVQADVMSAVFSGVFPDNFWNNQDDLCDCTYQRIGMWTNPYLAETLEVRLCCMWAEFEKQHPQFIRRTPAFKDGNARAWVADPAEWNGETPMPKSLWYRQMALKEDRPVSEIRAEYEGQDHLRPQGAPRPEKHPFILYACGEWIPVEL